MNKFHFMSENIISKMMTSLQAQQSGAKQSSEILMTSFVPLDCFVAYAPRNDAPHPVIAGLDPAIHAATALALDTGCAQSRRVSMDARHRRATRRRSANGYARA
jgi:hypothetical protein